MPKAAANQWFEPAHGALGPFDLNDDLAYQTWRKKKLALSERRRPGEPVLVDHPPSPAQLREIADRCQSHNFAIYAFANPPNVQETRRLLPSFAAALGLADHENHRSSETDGIVSLEVSHGAAKRGFIPYTNRPLNWHTDGYYNDPNQPIRAFLLHCVRPARAGGSNRLLDPEIAYIRLRDADPDHINTLMHPHAMSIPAHREASGRERPAAIGPVFMVDPETGQLAMRYTARSHNVVWRDDAETTAAREVLANLLTDGDPLMFEHRLEPGQGLACNNVLHCRTGFEDAAARDAGRLLLRMRFRSRIGEPGSVLNI